MAGDLVMPPDSYNLVDGNWPAESETAYAAAGTAMTGQAAAYTEAAGNARRAAAEISDWRGQAGETAQQLWNQIGGRLDGHSSGATAVAGRLTGLAAMVIAMTKTHIIEEVERATPLITRKKAEEEAYKADSRRNARPAPPTSTEMVENSKGTIQSYKDSYESSMDRATASLGKGIPPGSPPTISGDAPGQSAPAQPGGYGERAPTPVSQPVSNPARTSPGTKGKPTAVPAGNSTTDKAAKGDTPGLDAPQKSGSSGSPGGSSSQGGSPGGQSGQPSSSQPGSNASSGVGSQGSQNGDQGSGASQGGNQGASSTGSDSGGHHGADSGANAMMMSPTANPSTTGSPGSGQGANSGTGQGAGSGSGQGANTGAGTGQGTAPGSSAPGSSAPAGGGGASAVAPKGLLGGMNAPTAAPGLGGIPGGGAAAAAAAAPTTNLSSTAPAGTGATPGASGGPGSPGAVQGTSGQGASGQTTQGAGQPQGSGATRSGMPDMSTMRDGSGTGPSTVSGAAGGQGAAAGGTTGQPKAVAHTYFFTKADEESVAQLSSYVKALNGPDQMAHRGIAAMAAQFQRVGWGGEPIAIGVYEVPLVDAKGTRPMALFATADGVALLPKGIHTPAGLFPVTRVSTARPEVIASLAGMDNPMTKLEQLVPSSFGKLEAMVSLDDVDVAAINRSSDAAPTEIPRSRHKRLGLSELSHLDSTINAGLIHYGRPDLKEVTRDLLALRWPEGGEKPKGYDRALRAFFFSEALALHGTDRDETGYSIGELEKSPEIERDR